MLAFAGASHPSRLLLLLHHRHRHRHRRFNQLNLTRLNADFLTSDAPGDDPLHDDDDDDVDDLGLFDDYEDGSFRKGRRQSSWPGNVRKSSSKLELPASKKKSMKLCTSNPVINKRVKVIAKRPETKSMKPPTTHNPNRTLKPVLHAGDYDLGLNQVSRLSGSTWEDRAYEFIRKKKLKESLGSSQVTNQLPRKEKESVSSTQLSCLVTKDNSNHRMLSELELEIKCQPVVEYLISLGLDESQLRKIARKRKACFYVKFSKVKERLEYLRSIGVKDEDMRKVIAKHPQVLEYTIERMMKPRIQYLQSIGVPESRMGRVITVSPSLLECSLEGSLKRRVRFLVEEVGVSKEDVWKVVLLSPQVLTQSIEGALRPRMNFLLKKLGISHERVAKMITKHPQLLHYSISNGIQPRIDFLTSIGMSDPDVATILCRSSQILSLSVDKSLRPKCDYLTKELKCSLQILTSFPAYLSLSLEKRIRPRHKFLESRNRLPAGPFPMHLLAITDEEFCERWAKSTVEEYHVFRQSLLLTTFAKQFEKRHRWNYNQ